MKKQRKIKLFYTILFDSINNFNKIYTIDKIFNTLFKIFDACPRELINSICMDNAQLV